MLNNGPVFKIYSSTDSWEGDLSDYMYILRRIPLFWSFLISIHILYLEIYLPPAPPPHTHPDVCLLD